MWHEARKRERATQKLFNDHKKRAEKRREENRVDPSSFLQVNGVKAKLCLDPNVYKQAATSMVAWQGDSKVMIDRFDVRTTLESIPKEAKVRSKDSKQTSRSVGVLDIDETKPMKTLLDYERYRLLMQNDLHGVGEESRLNLVAKSDIISDMKLKKLKGNRFGTSGESAPSTADYVPSQRAHIRGPAKHMSAAGPTYNSVPPPSSLTSSQNSSSWRYDQQSSSPPDSLPSVANKVIDLDDYDNYDPDLVDVREDCKQASDVAKKYGLSSEELILLSKLDNRDASLKESLVELKKIQLQLLNTASQQVYGPALPPNVAARQENKEPIVSSDSDDDDSQVPQRSPSAMIPCREEPRVPSAHPSDDETRAKLDVKPLPPCASSPVNEPESIESIQPSEQPTENGRHQESSPQLASTRRRASTPLAYKRNRRSSRSLSRERRRDKSNARHRRRRNSSSSSSSASTSSSEQQQQKRPESNSRRYHSENRSRKRTRD